jgi:hypothetical protein
VARVNDAAWRFPCLRTSRVSWWIFMGSRAALAANVRQHVRPVGPLLPLIRACWMPGIKPIVNCLNVRRQLAAVRQTETTPARRTDFLHLPGAGDRKRPPANPMRKGTCDRGTRPAWPTPRAWPDLGAQSRCRCSTRVQVKSTAISDLLVRWWTHSARSAALTLA